jgi:FRG domain
MKTTNITSVSRLLRSLNALPNHYMFRGHADHRWRLESSLERTLGSNWSPEKASKYEGWSLDHFRSKFHLYDTENVRPESKLAWLSIMQHYGVPTRLLDFSESPYVALYFALEAYRPETKKDFAVIAIDYTALMERSIEYISKKNAKFRETRQSIYPKQDRVFEKVVDLHAYNVAWIAEPRQFNARLDRQAGSFLLSGNPGRRIKDILSLPTYRGATVIKYRISASLYTAAFALLRKMNVTSKSIYGNLDGLARSIRMQMQAYSN